MQTGPDAFKRRHAVLLCMWCLTWNLCFAKNVDLPCIGHSSLKYPLPKIATLAQNCYIGHRRIWQDYNNNHMSVQIQKSRILKSLNLSFDLKCYSSLRLSLILLQSLMEISSSSLLKLWLPQMQPWISQFQSLALWNYTCESSTYILWSLSEISSHCPSCWNVSQSSRPTHTKAHSCKLGSGPSFAGNPACDYGELTASLWLLISLFVK